MSDPQSMEMSPTRFSKICIFGAGAIGGALAARLATAPSLSDASISIVARGSHLQAIRDKGIHLYDAGRAEPSVAHVHATDTAAELGLQDLVIVTLKGHQLTAASGDIVRLLKPETRVVAIQNGIPWWYFHKDKASAHEGKQIEALDPDGLLRDRIGPERIIGGVIYQGARISAPGHVHLSGAGTLHLGEPSGDMSQDLLTIAKMLEASRWTVKTTPRIRDEIWLKLQGNAAFNPVSALTRATIADIVEGPLLGLTRQIMDEVGSVARSLGCRIEMTTQERINHSRGLGTAKTSMLQDIEAGRPMEITPLTRAVTLLGQMTGVSTPANDIVLSLVNQLDRSMAEARRTNA